MVLTITVEEGKVTKNLTKWVRKLPQSNRRGTMLFSNRLARAIRDTAKAKGLNVTGYLSSKKGTASVKIDKDTWGIKMPYYTEMLEKGTDPHFIPRTWKTQLAAKKYGMSFFMLRAIISGQGTRPHPFVARVIMNEVQNIKEPKQQIHNAIKAR